MLAPFSPPPHLPLPPNCGVGNQHQLKSDLGTLKVKVYSACRFLVSASQQQSVSQGRFCLNICTCCHTDRWHADQTCLLTKAYYTNTRLTSPSTNPILLDARQGCHKSIFFFGGEGGLGGGHWHQSNWKNGLASHSQNRPEWFEIVNGII